MADDSKHDYIVPSILLLMALAIGLWMLFGSQIRSVAWVALRAQVGVVEPIASLYPASYQADFRQLKRILSKPVNKELPAGALWLIVSTSGKFLVPFVVLSSLALAIWILMRSPAWRYRRKLTFEQLLTVQARQFPRMRPILWLAGRTTREQRGNYWWPLSPYEWATTVKCLTGRREPQATEESFNPDRAKLAFAAQLGRPSTGERFLHEDLLLAVFACRVLDRKRDAILLLDAAAAGFGPSWGRMTLWWKTLIGKQLDWPANGPWQIVLLPKAEALLRKTLKELEAGAREAAQHPGGDAAPMSPAASVMRLFHRSAHLRCSLARLMSAAQGTGIVSTSDFIWLKAVDRSLHYVLNDVGRRVATCESSGVRAHMLAEDAAGRALHEPQVDAALTALRKSLAETGWSPPPAMDFNGYLASMASSDYSQDGGSASLADAIADAKGPMPIPPAGMFASE